MNEMRKNTNNQKEKYSNKKNLIVATNTSQCSYFIVSLANPLWINTSSWDHSFSKRYFSYMCVRTQQVITCSKLTIETLEQGVKYIQSYQ